MRASDWVSVKDGLPTVKTWYLVWIPEWRQQVESVFWDDDWFVWTTSGMMSIKQYKISVGFINITHWMPIVGPDAQA